MGSIEADRDQGRGGDAAVRAAVFVRGRVQGAGFRWWTRARALELGLGLAGWARNTADGRVEVVAEPPRPLPDFVCHRAATRGVSAPGPAI